ncbi:MAG: SMC-Scp complex subunit ScpB [Clostridiales bacterium]|jgi:segregation and condensation protein B|nr:SMC-Scp complex subunit ScpB [Clostridiales bacterium]
MEKSEIKSVILCVLFVAGDPVPILELQRALGLTDIELRPVLFELQAELKEQRNGILLTITEESAQLCSNKVYAKYVEELLQPAQQKTFSQTLIETLAIIAYRQPVTRADIEAVRGVRCEYAVAQLHKMNMIQPVGRKDAVGKPVLFGTTDGFLRHFGIQSVNELPNYEAYSKGEEPIEAVLTV